MVPQKQILQFGSPTLGSRNNTQHCRRSQIYLEFLTATTIFDGGVTVQLRQSWL
jgi:hypothetical protein